MSVIIIKVSCTEKGKYAGCIYWVCDEMIEALNFCIDNMNARFGNKLYLQVVGIKAIIPPM